MRSVAGWCNLLIAVGTLLVSACGQNPDGNLRKTTRFMMGTVVEVIVVGPGDAARKITEEVFDELKRVEDLTSFHKESPLTRLNEAAGTGPVRTDPELLWIISEGLRFAAQSRGAFDPTVGPLTRQWNFSGGEPRLPEESEIAAALKTTGWKKVNLDSETGTIILPEPGMALDLGGIAKGYALDRAREVLKRSGAVGALVNAGGDILALGEKEPGKPWRIGVQEPRNPRGMVAVASIKDKIIVTSGDYERFFIHNGRRYHHVLDPKTGYPTEGLQSATIVASDGVTADATATAVFPLGVEEGLKYIESIPGAAGLLIGSDGRMHFSSAARSLLKPAK